MKNIIVHESVGERYKFLCGLFKTEILDCKQVKEIVLAVAQMPIFAFEYSDNIEWTHFSSWWNGLSLRYNRYTNDYINDLYYVHELHHIASKKVGFADFDSWMNNKIAEEFESSVVSEMLVYVWMPWLREKTFKQEILFDQIAYPTEESCRQHRKDVIRLLKVGSEAEIGIQKYVRNNVLWANIWADVAEEIENACALLTIHDTNTIKNHITWLESKSTDLVPFKEKAEEFQAKMEK